MTARPPARKTYSRLATGRRVPSEYEVVSSDLHYNHPHRFELPTGNPVVSWYYRHREGSRLQADNWEAFADPRRTTYRGYNESQDRKEDVIDGLLREIDDTGYDDGLSEDWVAFLDRWYAPLRFPAHGLQMLAAYIAQLAPASRITNCAAFQSADEMRRLQRIAYRTVQLSAHRSRGRALVAPADLGGRGRVPAPARAHRASPGHLRLGGIVRRDQRRHQAAHRPPRQRGDRRHARRRQRRSDPAEHPLLARRGCPLAS